MRKSYLFTTMVTAIVLCLFMAGASVASEKKSIVFATSSSTGTYYVLGGGLCMAFEKDIPEIKEAIAQVTAGSVENVRLIDKGEADLALANAVVVAEAYRGSERFKGGLKNLQTLCWAQVNSQHYIVAKKSGIKSLADLKGKKVSVGAPGSGTAFNFKSIMDSAGINLKDLDVQFLNNTAAIDAFKDDRLDCIAVAGNIPSSTIYSLAMTNDIDIISIDEKIIDKLHAELPGYVKVKIPAGTYKGMDTDVYTFGAANTLLGNSNLSADVVYKMLKTIQAQKDWLTENIHKGFSEFSFDPSVSDVAPLHPGAVKFYNEIGRLK